MTRPPPALFAGSFEKVSLFQCLPPEATKRIQTHCNWRRYEPGELILDYLDKSDDVFFITDGEARVSIYSLQGKAVTFSDLAAGEIFGEIAAIDGAPRSASIEARTHCCVASMSRHAFLQMLESEPRVALELLRHMVVKVRALMDDYGSITFTSEYAEGILLVTEEYFQQAFADAEPGPDLDFLRSLVPYVWARWR